MSIFIVILFGRVSSNAGIRLRHTISLIIISFSAHRQNSKRLTLFKTSLREFLLEKAENLLRKRCCASGKSAKKGQVIPIDQWISDKSDEDWRHKEEFLDLVLDSRVKEIIHRESRKHVDFSIDCDGKMKGMNQSSN